MDDGRTRYQRDEDRPTNVPRARRGRGFRGLYTIQWRELEFLDSDAERAITVEFGSIDDRPRPDGNDELSVDSNIVRHDIE